MPVRIIERIDMDYRRNKIDTEDYYTDEEKKDIILCLECPYPTCTNCLERKHKPGVRPDIKAFNRRMAITDMLLEGKYPLYVIARLAHSSMATVKTVEAEMKEAGRI